MRSRKRFSSRNVPQSTGFVIQNRNNGIIRPGKDLGLPNYWTCSAVFSRIDQVIIKTIDFFFIVKLILHAHITSHRKRQHFNFLCHLDYFFSAVGRCLFYRGLFAFKPKTLSLIQLTTASCTKGYYTSLTFYGENLFFKFTFKVECYLKPDREWRLRKLIRRMVVNFKNLQDEQMVFFPFWRLIFKICMLNSFQLSDTDLFYGFLRYQTRSCF